MPAGWILSKLNDIADINPRLDKTKIPDDSLVVFVPMASVGAGDGKIDIRQKRYFSEVKKGFTPFQSGDIIFAKITPSMENGKIAVNPFAPANLQDRKHCLSALNVEKLMEWWPGTPHSPHRDPNKVSTIQRALDWKRVVQIAAYLLQREIIDVPERLDQYFKKIYEPKKAILEENGHQKLAKWSVMNAVNFRCFQMYYSMLMVR